MKTRYQKLIGIGLIAGGVMFFYVFFDIMTHLLSSGDMTFINFLKSIIHVLSELWLYHIPGFALIILGVIIFVKSSKKEITFNLKNYGEIGFILITASIFLFMPFLQVVIMTASSVISNPDGMGFLDYLLAIGHAFIEMYFFNIPAVTCIILGRYYLKKSKLWNENT